MGKKPQPGSEEALREYALKLLSLRARSRAELRERCLGKGYETKLVDALLDRFNSAGLLDDREFARALARYHRHLRPLGRFGLASALAAKGLDKALISEIVAESLPFEEELAAAREIAQKQLNRSGDERSKWQKLVNLLRRRGFSYQIIERLRAELAKSNTSDAEMD